MIVDNMKYINQPAIKWTGSKRPQSKEIIKAFPNYINTYYEPFCGGCSVLCALLQSDIKANHFECSDLNKDLINLWNTIKSNHKELIKAYIDMWNELNKDNNQERRNSYYYKVRERLNKFHNPIDFNFIMRNSVNGMARYNSKGDFNSSFHFTRKGINPINFESIINSWNLLLNQFNVDFICRDYKDIHPNKNDYLYLDPPYANTKGLYFGGIDLDELWEWLRNIPCKYSLSFDGSIGNKDLSFDIPKDIYDEHIFIESGKSSFRRLINSVKENKNSKVYESLYITNKLI